MSKSYGFPFLNITPLLEEESTNSETKTKQKSKTIGASLAECLRSPWAPLKQACIGASEMESWMAG